MDGVLQVNSMSQCGAGGREPLGTLSRNNTRITSGGRRRKGSASRAAARRGSESSAAESQHIARVRASRSAGNIGLESLYQPAKEKLLSSTALYGGQLGTSASATELGGFGFDTASTKSKSARRGSAPRERLAARRRGGAGAGAANGGPSAKSSRVVNAVQGLDQASKQALLDVIKMERQNRSAQQQKEESVDRMHAEAAHCAATKEEEQRVFEAISMIQATELEHQAEAGGQILQFCATAVEPCPAMIMRAAAVYGRLHQAYSSAGTERVAAVSAEREKWEAKEASAERRHKEALSKLGATMGTEMRDMKANLEAITAERDSAQTQAQEMAAKHAAEAKRSERISAKLAALQEASSASSSTPAGESDDAAGAAVAGTAESSGTTEEAAKEIALLKAAVVASDKEMKEMKTRLKKMLGKSKKDQASNGELSEALQHARAQLAALMEEMERLKQVDTSSAAAGGAPEPAAQEEDLSEFAGKLKDLEIAATRGQAPSLNIDRGTAEGDMSLLPEGTVTTEIAIPDAEQHGSPSAGDSVFGGLGMGDIVVGGEEDGGLFGGETSGASPIASTEMTMLAGEASFFEEQDGKGLDAGFIVAEDKTDDLRREVEQLRLRNAELEQALDKALDSGSDSEDDDAPLSCAKKPMGRTGMPPLARPNGVPALVRSHPHPHPHPLAVAVAVAVALHRQCRLRAA
eukprot:COSAG06_NODE_965_length_11299_cov_14.725536_1_plen_693_part_00